MALTLFARLVVTHFRDGLALPRARRTGPQQAAAIGTATKNMEFLLDRVEPGARDHLTALLAAVNTAPKSAAWKVRSLIGDRKQWWQDVDIPRDTY